MSEEARSLPILCRVLERDPELAEAIPEAKLAQAINDCLVHEISIPAGRWAPPPGEGIGLLVLSGLLIRRSGVGGRFSSELLGDGDLLRPWQTDGEPPILRVVTSWRVLEPIHVAILDEAFLERIATYPELAGKLVARALSRSRNLAVNTAIIHHARVDVRLHMLFWHLAARWGRVRTGEVVLPLRLTHAVLAEITAARRPTVTSALSELARRGLVLPNGEGGWLLYGEPPGEPVSGPPAALSVGGPVAGARR
jgi:CRP/FNR family cyclic AMP-dependent transcriptional regulator